MEVAGKRCTLMGLGRHGGGLAAARWLAEQGARVTITDLCEADTLADSIAALAGVPIADWTLGRHDERDFLAADVIVINPAVRPGHPLVELARANGKSVTSEIELLLDRCPAPTIGVTGSNGKSTTASFLSEIFAAAGERVWLGGNIGRSLLPHLDEIRPTDRVVLELSSFQLAQLSPTARFPDAAIVTNCTANHLDWHGSPAAYVRAKQRLLCELPAGGIAVLNRADPEVHAWSRETRARVIAPWPLERVPALAIPGTHNRQNAACAAALASELGIGSRVIEGGLARFTGLAHRCAPAGVVEGRELVNDSKSTTPEATLAALAACTGPIWVLLGGLNKGPDFTHLARELGRRAAGAGCFGAAGGELARLIGQHAPKLPLHSSVHLHDALAWCWAHSRPGDTILLSPACASLDQFRDFEHRASVFLEWIEGLRSATVTSATVQGRGYGG